MQPLFLLPGREKRILQGHRWVFNNEIDGRLPDFEPGSWVEVFSSKRVPLGRGYINPRSLIAVRLVTGPGQEPTREFFSELLRRAEEKRTLLYYPGSTCHRVVFGESDGIPGLIVDRYGDVLVIQVTTLGMARMQSLIQELMVELFRPAAIVCRNDTSVRRLEGLPLEKGLAFGELPEDIRVNIDGLELRVDPLGGQKTGLFLDQRDNRRALLRWIGGKRVLDLFCYTGAWGLAAARGGASRVVGVDASAEAVDQARSNAAANNVADRCEFIRSEALQYLRTLRKGDFDVIVLDPPAFAKTKSALPEAQKGYTDLNRRALLALAPGGLLVTCSCSYHMSEELFARALLQAARAGGRQLRLMESRGQAPDHPVLLAMPETRYLKCWFLEVV
ncbi:class I SAM-dependent rRNA methyltransferase [Syntrophobacter fumaroxidans]|uniref:SAM-dependent methyltransferase n=1 Tax=Syntrophobacter fumaroxidans (strain DSM 10017 / MPOB) TaxID=335543 RepID=A0LJE8_SYNFM|nr:class I SAM-dependent rRNA methyltransferase [Syntrophobacter fumaroxidans]ABK17550.1 SAM-dependent methyltransferase [Syntrophobacter fumaroxidans MPOB]